MTHDTLKEALETADSINLFDVLIDIAVEEPSLKEAINDFSRDDIIEHILEFVENGVAHGDFTYEGWYEIAADIYDI